MENGDHLLLDNIPDPVIVTTTDFKIDFINSSARMLFQYADGEANGEYYHNLLFSGQQCSVFNQLKGEVENGTKWDGEILMKSKSGKALLSSLACAPVLNGTSQIHGFIFQVKSTQLQNVNFEPDKNNDILYKELFSNMTNGVAVYEVVSNANNFKFVDINKAGLKIGNHEDTDILGELITDVYPDVVESGLFEALRKVWSTGKPIFIPLKSYEDERIRLWVENYIFKLPSGQIVTVYNDLTEKHKAEEAITRNKNFYENILEEVKEIICVSDKDAEIKFINTRAKEFFNFGKSSIIGQNLISDFPASITDKLLPFYHKAKDSLEPVQFETEFDYDNGKVTYVSCWFIPQFDRGHFDGMICSLQDVTEKKATQKSLIENEEKLNKITSSASDAIIVINGQQQITFWNKSAKRIFGYELEEMKQMSFTDLFANHYEKADLSELLEAQLSGVEASKSLSSVEIVGRPKNGSDISLELSLSSMKLNEKNNLVAVIRDITKRKKTEDELISAKIKAEASDNLKTAFLANLSHEIRTPMNAIIGLSDMIGDNTIDNDERSEYVELVQRNSKQLLRIIEDLIDVSKLGSGELELHEKKCKLNELLNETILDCQQDQMLEAKKINLTTRYPLGPDVEVEVDKQRVQQIVSVLVENAVKFTPTGSIEVGYDYKNEPGEREKIVMYVKDTGIGVDPENHSVIFEYFRQVDGSNTRQAGGTGVGLSIVKGILDLAEEKIWVESKLNEGATFFFTLSNIQRSEVPKVKKETPVVQNGDFPMWSDKKLLIVEDVDSNFLFLRKALQKTGINIEWAQDGLEAVEKFKADPGFHIVLMDINLPLLNGYEATAEIRKISATVPVIAQTAFVSQEEEIKCLDEGFTDYIPKPIRRNVLIEKMKNLID